MAYPRASGILLHPTSLPGGHGIGDLGPESYKFVDWLAAARQQYWQVLPIGPTGYGDSPYQTFSAFAGNPLLVDLHALIAKGWLAEGQLEAVPSNEGPIDYGHVVYFKHLALGQAWAGFKLAADADAQARFQAFCKAEAAWLDDYALYRAIKDAQGGASWSDWPTPLATREKAALAAAKKTLADELGFHRFCQWVFFDQWNALRAYAHAKNVRIIGDVPIFVAMDSADAWAHRALFHIDEACKPTVVAGVPPDYFSETGQLWGNPLYRWDAMARGRFAWWIARMRQALALYDLVRVDHFRGFEAYWEVPAGESTAIKGRWVKGPEAKLFKALQKALGDDLPIIAEDLGLITPPVEALRDGFGLPGMKILQFAFGDPSNAYLPHNFVPNCVVYTGTHDNDTSRGWFNAAPEAEKAYALSYMHTDEAGFTWNLIRQAQASVARLALVPVQDLLDLGSEARMNTPAVASGNWAWRLPAGALDADIQAKLAELAVMFGRTPESGMPQIPSGADDLAVETA